MVSYNANEGFLQINSGFGGQGFTKIWTPTIPSAFGGLDHVKYLVYLNQIVPLKNDGSQMIYEASIAGAQQIGDIPAEILPGVVNPKADLRIATGTLNIIDFARTDGSNPSFLVFDIAYTDETIYGIYERLPFGKPSFGGPGPDYHGFTHVFELAKRNREDPANDFTKVAISIDRKNSIVRYLVDDVVKFEVSRLGYGLDREYRVIDHGGPDELVDLPSVSLGFGTLTLLDATNPVKGVPLNMAMIAAGNINPNRPLVQLGLDYQYIDPARVVRRTGDDLNVGEAPYLGGPPFEFLVEQDNTTQSRLFGNGFLLRLRYLKASYTAAPCKTTC